MPVLLPRLKAHMSNSEASESRIPESREHIRTGLGAAALKAAFVDNLNYILGRPLELSTPSEQYRALAMTIRDRLLQRWIRNIEWWNRPDLRSVAYLSAEFLIGPQLANNLFSLGICDVTRQAMTELDLDLDEMLACEEEPGLGNGGLGRLAACYLDSLATLGYPAIGYGIRYEFGIFDQDIRDGWQVERTDKWLRFGNPWEIAHPELSQVVKLGGRTETYQDDSGRSRVRWVPDRVVVGVPHDMPILGYGVETCSLLRLWRAEAAQSFDFADFNRGDYYGAVEEKVFSENISKVLYPNDEALEGKKLRLEQQYFLAACSIKDMIRLCLRRGLPVQRFDEMHCVQLNDTHPSIAVAELMRQLIDKYVIDWDLAWKITRSSLAYTNHTLLPEALERWPLPLFASVLPRHIEIIYEINRRFLDRVRQVFPGDEARVRNLSIIDEDAEKSVRMANLAVIGSHAVNGVAELHSQLVKTQLFPDFFALEPTQFFNVTNGVTPRRFLLVSNPELARLIVDRIGHRWIHRLDELRQLEDHVDDADFRQRWLQVKHGNKERLAKLIARRCGVTVDPASLFDVHVKRVHEYKRQHLNILHVITLYLRLRHDSKFAMTPRTVIFGGKAAPGYFMAKRIIKLANAVAEAVNGDPQVKDRLKVVFFPDYNVQNAQQIYPAADLSEQISTAGKEASGTGNMKLALNGALTIGTLDGANIEIREEVGAENFFLFGLTASQADQLRESGYRPMDHYHGDPELKEAIDLISSGFFSHGDRELFRPLTEHLLYHDNFLLLADYRAYVDCQQQVDHAYMDRDHWARMSILNVARCGKFSSDRAVSEYARDIWKIAPITVQVDGAGGCSANVAAGCMGVDQA